MGSLKEIFKRNIIWILMILVAVFACIICRQDIDIPVVSQADTYISFETDSLLEQTWQANIKRADQISISYLSQDSFEGRVALKIFEDDGNTLIAEAVRTESFGKDENGSLVFDIDVKRFEIGSRYRIQMQFSDFASAGSLLLEAGTGYAGGSIDGTALDAAAAFHMNGIKTSSISWLVLTLFPYISFSLFFMILWERKWEEVIGISMIAATGIMTFGGMFGFLEQGIYFIHVLSIICLIVSIYLYNRKKGMLKELISPGIIFWGILFVLILINCNNLHLARADEFTHWGLSVKDMYTYNSLTKHPGTVVWHIYYPPFMPVIEYYFMYMNGFYVNKFLYIAYQVMMLSCLSVIFKAACKKVAMAIPAMVVMLSGVIIFYNTALSDIYADTILAVFVAYSLICYFTEELTVFNYIRILGGLLALTYTKPAGAVLAGLITLIIIGDVLYKQIMNKKINLRAIILPCLSTVFVCALYLGWQFYLSIPIETVQETVQVTENVSGVLSETGAATVNITSASGINVTNIVNLLTGKGPEYRYKVIKNFIIYFFMGDAFNIANLEISFFECFLFVGLCVWLVQGFLSSNKEKNVIVKFGIFTSIAGILYAGFLLLTYMFAFSEQDGVSLNHIPRYMGSWICGVVIALGGILLIKITDSEKICNENVKRIIIAVCILFVFVTPTKEIRQRRSDIYLMDERNERYNNMLEVLRTVADRNESIAFIGDESSLNEWSFYQYVVCPLKAENLEQETSVEEWRKVLENCQYAFLAIKDTEFNDKYRLIFGNEDTAEEGALYKVVWENNTVSLQYIGSTQATMMKFE